MSKRKFSFFLLISLLTGLAGWSEEPAPPRLDVPKEVTSDIKVLRESRYHQMPYLDRGFIRSVLNKNSAKDKNAFLSGADKTLETVIGRAIQVHTPARAARERVSLAKRRILVALRNLFPEAKFELNRRTGDLSSSDFNSWNYKLSFRQPVFRGGILWNTLLQEKADLEAAEKEYDAVIGDVIRDVSSAFAEYSRAVQSAEDQKKILDHMRKYLDLSEQKHKGGLVSEIEHLNVQSLFSQAEYDYETAKQEIELAKLEMQKYLDLGLHDDFGIVKLYHVDTLLAEQQKLSNSDADPNSYQFEAGIIIPELSELVDLAYLNRPELQVEAAKLQSARLEERIRWGEMVPRVDVFMDAGETGEAFNSINNNPPFNEDFRFGIEMNWNAIGNNVGYTFERDERAPSVTQFQSGTGSNTRRNQFTVGVLDGLQELADAKEAEVLRLEAVIELEKQEKEVIHDVKQAFFDFQKAKIQVQSSLQRLDYRKRLADLAQHRMEKNEVQISDYLQAENDLAKDIASLHKALSDYYRAKADLNHSVGIPDFLSLRAQEKHGNTSPGSGKT